MLLVPSSGYGTIGNIFPSLFPSSVSSQLWMEAVVDVALLRPTIAHTPRSLQGHINTWHQGPGIPEAQRVVARCPWLLVRCACTQALLLFLTETSQPDKYLRTYVARSCALNIALNTKIGPSESNSLTRSHLPILLWQRSNGIRGGVGFRGIDGTSRRVSAKEGAYIG